MKKSINTLLMENPELSDAIGILLSNRKDRLVLWGKACKDSEINNCPMAKILNETPGELIVITSDRYVNSWLEANKLVGRCGLSILTPTYFRAMRHKGSGPSGTLIIDERMEATWSDWSSIGEFRSKGDSIFVKV